MALLILPRNDSAAEKARVSSRLEAEIANPITVEMLVFGNGPGVSEVLEVASARASVKGPVRRVIWIKDPELLSAELQAKYVLPNRVAVSVGLDEKVADSLTAAKARSKIFVERAFLKAEGQL